MVVVKKNSPSVPAFVQNFLQSVDEKLHEPGLFTDALGKLEQKTGMKRLHSIGALAAIYSLILLFGPWAGPLCTLTGILYPSYLTKKALDSPNATADMEVLLVYWVVFGWLSYCDFFLSRLPAYWLLKCALLLYLQSPVTSGVHQLYSFFHRFLSAGINGGKKDLIGADSYTGGWLKVEMHKITDYLYLTDIVGVSTRVGQGMMKGRKIKRVLTVSTGPMRPKQVEGVEYIWLDMEDNFKQDLLGTGLLHQALSLIESAEKSRQPIVVHCDGGVSRSPTIVCAHLMKKHGWGVEEAIEHVKKIRRIVNPNVSFRRQLKIFEDAGYNASNGKVDSDEVEAAKKSRKTA